MKLMPRWCIAVMLTLIAYSSPAQTLQKKSSLFSAYPVSVDCPVQQLNSLFTAANGQPVQLALSEKFILKGTLKNKINKYGKIETLFIQLPSFDNILLSVSRRMDEQKNYVYSAHLFNRNFSDGYELKRGKNNVYRFEKIETEKILPLCNL